MTIGHAHPKRGEIEWEEKERKRETREFERQAILWVNFQSVNVASVVMISSVCLNWIRQSRGPFFIHQMCSLSPRGYNKWCGCNQIHMLQTTSEPSDTHPGTWINDPPYIRSSIREEKERIKSLHLNVKLFKMSNQIEMAHAINFPWAFLLSLLKHTHFNGHLDACSFVKAVSNNYKFTCLGLKGWNWEGERERERRGEKKWWKRLCTLQGPLCKI